MVGTPGDTDAVVGVATAADEVEGDGEVFVAGVFAVGRTPGMAGKVTDGDG